MDANTEAVDFRFSCHYKILSILASEILTIYRNRLLLFSVSIVALTAGSFVYEPFEHQQLLIPYETRSVK